MSSAKVYVVITDHGRKTEVVRSPGTAKSVYSFSGYVVGNPAVQAYGATEGEVLDQIRDILLYGEGGIRKIVEIDVGDEVVLRDVMET